MALFKWFKKNKKEEIKEQEVQHLTQEEITQETVTKEIEQDILEDVPQNVIETLQEEEITNDEIKITPEFINDTIDELTEDILNSVPEEDLKKINDLNDLDDNFLEEETEITEEILDNALEELLQEGDLSNHIAENEINNQIGKNLAQEIASNIKEEINQQLDNKKKQDLLEDLEEKKQKENLQQETEKQENNKKGFFSKIKQGLSKTRDSILNGVEQVLSSFTKIDEELFEELEESLIMSDIGVETSIYIIEKVRQIVKTEKIKDVAQIKDVIVRVICEILEEETQPFSLKSPSVILVIGVNGVGKTTTIGKLSNNFKSDGKKVLLAAGDTFRAAAIDQLQVWGERSGIDVIKHQEGSDPAAVVFDAIQASKARGTDILICDTAGRLHNKKNLMEELKKISRIVNRENPDAQVETLLVLDATTGQNALQQAKLFNEVADITGIVLTKLDGTAKGGVVIAIKNELKIPVRFIGVGEGIEDLRPFDATEFSKALFE